MNIRKVLINLYVFFRFKVWKGLFWIGPHRRGSGLEVHGPSKQDRLNTVSGRVFITVWRSNLNPWFDLRLAVLIDGINSVFVWLRLDQIRNQKSKLEKNFGSNWMKRSRSNSTEKSTWNIWPDEISKEIIHAKSMTEDTKSLFGINSRSKNLCCVLKQSNELSVNASSFRYPAKKVIQESWKKISI